ncbi:unnamed protein product [Rotaria sordida]|uniref:Uncharacterized protein n=1 Tax=Rotaria sordida TaxID=392033 RepID=A0A818M642_9BILA|nr:unnamed protein product [Rotaria sordida]
MSDEKTSILNVWLNTNRNYQEIQRWYRSWHLLFPQAIINHIIIKEKLTKDLMMINQRISGTFNVQQTSPSQPFAIYNHGIAISSSTVISSFKDLVEKEATKHNLLFLPIQNRTSEDKQIYQFENVKSLCFFLLLSIDASNKSVHEKNFLHEIIFDIFIIRI